MSYPNDPALAFRNIVIESTAGVLASIVAALGCHLLRFPLQSPPVAIMCGFAGVAFMNFTHERLGGNR